MTKKEIAEAILGKQKAADSLSIKGLENLSEDEGDQLIALLDGRDELKAKFDALPDENSVKARLDAGSRFSYTPSLGVPHPVPGFGETTPEPKPFQGEFVTPEGQSATEKFLKKGPFKSLGHYAYEIKRCGTKQSGMYRDGILGQWNKGIIKTDDSIKALGSDIKATGGLTEFSDPDGASFVPTDMSTEIWSRVFNPLSLMGQVNVTPVSGNGYTLPAWNDATRTSGSVYGGAHAYWTDEVNQITASKPATRKVTWKLNKLAVLMPVSDELLEDTTALDARLGMTASAAFTLKINTAIINGTGVGQPKGLLNEGCKITTTAVSGQGVNTIVASNIDSMFARRAPSITDWRWLYLVDCEPQFANFNYNISTTNTGVAATWVYLPPNGISQLPNGSLKGKPMDECENCSALGTEGDIILWSPSNYGVIVKSTGINSAVSMHLYFDYDQAAFRWTFRIDGRSFWDAPLTPATGATRSPIVTLNSTRT